MNKKDKNILIKDLKRVNLLYIDQTGKSLLTRDFYRIHGKFSDKQVNSVFGSFGSFRDSLLEDPEVLKFTIKLAKQKQKLQDLNRIERKSFREYARLDNSLEEYSKEIIKILEKNAINKFKINEEKHNGKYLGVVQLSDLHFNELVLNQDNEYSFDIASKRLKKLAILIKDYFKVKNITNLLITFTGDFLNSDRRLDEKLNMANNRAKASILAVFILQQFILDLTKSFSTIQIAGVSGNESRVNEESGYTDIIITDNYDYTIINMLKIMFKNLKKNIIFHDMNYKETIIDINNYVILILHGEGIKNEKDVQSIIGKYAYKGIIVNYVLFGHIHQAFIADFFARSASLVGGNSYSDKGLHLVSRASQNIHIIELESKSVDSIKIDLQNIENIEGYDVMSELEAYNIKSASKLRDNKAIIEIRI